MIKIQVLSYCRGSHWRVSAIRNKASSWWDSYRCRRWGLGSKTTKDRQPESLPWVTSREGMVQLLGKETWIHSTGTHSLLVTGDPFLGVEDECMYISSNVTFFSLIARGCLETCEDKESKSGAVLDVGEGGMEPGPACGVGQGVEGEWTNLVTNLRP